MSAWFVEDPQVFQIFKHKNILELGAGPGLCGLIAANVAKKVVLSDYMDIVMELIDKNIEMCNPKPE